ncbi:MAG: YgjV family protein [Oscillospiraceae bacterium]|nr:YgjV family protein [Oscillospiraceae bacterium]
MDPAMLIEMIGYLGSVLVLVSMLMSSVIKLRIINTVGSVIFAIYAFIIQSYPTAIMNVILVGVNIYNLIKLLKTTKEYDLVEVKADDSFAGYFLEHYKKDIEIYFPEFRNEDFFDAAYIICCKTDPAGIFLGKKNGSEILISLEYTSPMYRDCSVGKFLYENLSNRGINRLVYKNADKKHAEYLEKMGYLKGEEGYIKEI